MTTPENTIRMCAQLNSYLYRNVWNAPNLELRHNYVLRVVSTATSTLYDSGSIVYKQRAIPIANVVNLDTGTLSLPKTADGAISNNRLYYVYAAPMACFHGIKITAPNWTKLDSLLNNTPFDFRIHGADGEWLWRAGVYVCVPQADDTVLFAIDRNMASYILDRPDKSYDFMRMCLSVYMDSDYITPPNTPTTPQSPFIYCFYPTTLTERNAVFALATTTPSKKIVFVNGRESQLYAAEDVRNFDYIEIIHDPDIICRINLDLSKVGQNNTYRSSIHNMYKQIIHIPKTYNSENNIITHNTCDVFIRPKNTDNARLSGLFVHRFNTTDKVCVTGHSDAAVNGVYDINYAGAVGIRREWTKDNNVIRYNTVGGFSYWSISNRITSTTYAVTSSGEQNPYGESWTNDVQIRDFSDDLFTQLTHNDFAISDILIQAYRAALDSDEVGIHVVVRKHKKAKQLVFDSAYIKYLYRLPDAEIVRFLVGKGDVTLPFWQASELERSRFVNMMFDVPEHITTDNVTEYVNALGYYNTMNALGGRVKSFPIDGRMLVTDHPTPAVNGTYTLSTTISHCWENGIARIQFYPLDGAKYKLTYNAQIVAEQITGHENPCGSSWTSTIGGTVGDMVVTEYTTRTFLLTSAFLSTDTTNSTVHVYMRGLKLPDSDYSLSNTNQGVRCILKNTVIMPYGESLFIEVFDKPTFKVKYFTPSNDALNSGVPVDAIIYRFTAGTTAVDNYYTAGDDFITYMQAPTSGSYKRLSSDELAALVNTNGDTIVFKTQAVDQTFFMCSAVYYTSITQVFTLANLANGLIKSPPLTCVALDYDSLEEVTIPIPYDATCLVYLNNKELVEGIDYSYASIKDTGDQTISRVVFINNCDYLNSGSNKLEYVVTTTASFSKVDGFTNGHCVDDVRAVARYQPNLSVVIADGLCQPDITNSSWCLQLSTSVRAGALFKIRTMVPRCVKDFVDNIGLTDQENRINETTDITRIVTIVDFFRGRLDTDESVRVIEHSHHIYSLVMNEIIKDALAGTITLIHEPVRADMMAQVAAYLSIQDYDVALSGSFNTIVVSHAQQPSINGTYTNTTKNVVGRYRIWECLGARTRIIYSDIQKRWLLRSSNIALPTIFYVSEEDSTGQQDPWHMTWAAVDTGDASVPLLQSGNLNLKYIDLMPSYRTNETYSSDLYNCLRAIVNSLFAVDAIKDGETISLT